MAALATPFALRPVQLCRPASRVGATSEHTGAVFRRKVGRTRTSSVPSHIGLPVPGVVAALFFAGHRRIRRGARRSGPLQRAASASTGDAEQKKVVIVGGGPSGLAAALMLAQRGWSVTVLEKSKDPYAFDPGRGFVYLMDGRGQKCLQALDSNLMDELKANSVAFTEPMIGILDPKGLKKMEMPMKDKARESYWVPRHVFTRLLLDRVRKQENIELLCDMSVSAFHERPGRDRTSTSSGGFVVIAGTSDGQFVTKPCKLLLGADGLKSQVRAQLEEWDGGCGRFVPKEFDSPSAGLRYKVLTLPNGFDIETSSGPIRFDSSSLYSVRGANAEGRQLRLGILPVRPERELRTANLITWEDDPVWDISDEKSFQEYAKQQWPHFPIDSIVSAEELRRFAADGGGRFPRPQFTPKAAYSEQGEAQGPAALIVGDALHAFPPDLGQGVNSALEDVMAFRDALDAEGDDRPSAAASAYAARRQPESEALVHLMTFAAPFQYNQSPLRAKLWTMNFLARTLLHKACPWVFELPAFLLIQRSELSYTEVLRKSRRGTLAVSLLGASSAIAIALAMAKRSIF